MVGLRITHSIGTNNAHVAYTSDYSSFLYHKQRIGSTYMRSNRQLLPELSSSRQLHKKGEIMEVVNEQQKQIKILCIEDERFIRELYTRALENAGYSVTVCADGEVGLHEAVNGNYDVILLDIMIPTLNGVDILYKLRAPEVVPPLMSKIIVTTNLDQKEEIRKQVEQLADGYLIKAEITPKELVSFIQQVI